MSRHNRKSQHPNTTTAPSSSEIDLAWSLAVSDASNIEIDRSDGGAPRSDIVLR